MSSKSKSTSPWRAEVRRFCDTTSVKGVPKLMRARGPIRRTLWTSCVLLGAAMATYQSYILLKVYCDFETSTSVEFTNRVATFPDVTICKTNPPARINVGNFTLDDYLAKVTQLISKGNAAQDEHIKYLQGHSGYYQNVQVEDIHVQEALNDFILNCTYVLWNEEMEPCNITKQWWRFLTPAYPGCVTFQVIATPEFGRLRTLSLLLFLNNFASRDVTTFDIYPLVSYSTGARVFLHFPGHFPDLGRVVLAPPGRETIIQFNEVQRMRAEWPYSNCRDDRGYHHQQCMDECIQNASVRECSCLDLTIPTSPKARLDIPFCGRLSTPNITYNITTLVKTLKCRRDYGEPKVYKECEGKCPPECHTTTYHHRQMSAPWPHHSRHLAFHRDLIQNKSYAHKFNRYNTIRNITDPQKGMKMLEETTLINDNFLKVMVSFEFSDVMEYNDMPLTSPSALTGSLGAVLNLWSGVTFVTLVEVIDLLYSLCTAGWGTKNNDRNSNNTNQDQQQSVNLTMNDL